MKVRTLIMGKRKVHTIILALSNVSELIYCEKSEKYREKNLRR